MIPPSTNTINRLMTTLSQGAENEAIITAFVKSRRRLEIMKLIYQAFAKEGVITTSILKRMGVSQASAYRMLVIMAENGLITPHTLRNEGGFRPSTAWRLT